MLLIAFVQEAVEVVAATGLTAAQIQAAAAVLLPVAVQVLKLLVPSLEGKALFYVNMALNVLVAVGVVMGYDMPPAAALSLAVGGGFAGSKVIDIAKRRTVVLSDRHKK